MKNEEDSQIVYVDVSEIKLDEAQKKELLDEGRVLSDKMTAALNTLAPEFRSALAKGDFYSEEGIAALRALRTSGKKKIN